VDGVGGLPAVRPTRLLHAQSGWTRTGWRPIEHVAANDVANALREQNRQVAAGHVGQQPTATGQPFEFTVTTVGRLVDAEEFNDIVIRTDPDGRKVRIKDVGRAALGAKSLDQTSAVDGKPNASLAVFFLCPTPTPFPPPSGSSSGWRS